MAASNISVGVRIRPLLKTEQNKDVFVYDDHRSVKLPMTITHMRVY
jgi:hypothetical protein